MKPKHQASIIKKLRKKIPVFKCKPGCHDCCGWIPAVFWEKKQIVSLKGERRFKIDLNCPYVEDCKCSVYKERPILCQIYGASEEEKMTCPHGCKPEKTLSIEETKAIMKEYLNLKPKLLPHNDEVEKALKGKQAIPNIYRRYGKGK